MYVELGHSQEMANGTWRKFKMALDDTDYMSLLVEVVGDRDVSVEALAASLTTSQKWMVLENECQRLMLSELMLRFEVAMNSDENKAQLAGYKTRRDTIVNRAIEALEA